MDILPVTAELAIQAGRLHFHRKHSARSLADCIVAAAALTTSHPLATADPALANFVHVDGGHIYGHPDSAGQRP